jgi:predicted enzyme related to lactoylglutathione lyase
LATHRSRVCQFVIDVSDLDRGVAFWTAALDSVEEETSETSREIYRRIRLPDSEIRILLQKTSDRKTSKERMHIDLETDNVEAEVERLEALGAVRWDHQQERGFDFWVLRTPGVMNSAYYKKSSRNSWQNAAPGLPCPSRTDGLDSTQPTAVPRSF